MAKIPRQLQQAAEHVHNNNRPRSVKVRRFLSWFGVKRRGYLVVRQIRSALKRSKLITEPDFESAHIEGRIKLRSLPLQTVAKEKGGQTTQHLPSEIVPSEVRAELLDPTPRLGTLDPANRKPLAIKRDASLREAMTLMVKHDFSQLPVMQNDRDVDGLISWKSIGEASNLRNKECEVVRQCMDMDVEILKDDTPLWKAIRIIAEKDVVLVKNSAKEIVGLVTTYDIAVKYHSLAEPFLLLGEIENNLRQLIACAKYPRSVLEAAKDPKDMERKISSVSDLTFGEYIRLLQEPENWRLTGYNLARRTFLADLEEVRKIRNDVMHFHPDPLTDEQLIALRRAANMMRSLKLWSVSPKTETKMETATSPPSSNTTKKSTNRQGKLRIDEIMVLGRIKPGDKLTIAGELKSEAELIDAKKVRLADGRIMTWNEYGREFTGHVAVNIYRHVLVNGISLEDLR